MLMNKEFKCFSLAILMMSLVGLTNASAMFRPKSVPIINEDDCYDFIEAVKRTDSCHERYYNVLYPKKIESPKFHNRYLEDLKDLKEFKYEELEYYYNEEFKQHIQIYKGANGIMEVKLPNSNIVLRGGNALESYREFEGEFLRCIFGSKNANFCNEIPLNMIAFFELYKKNDKLHDIFFSSKSKKDFRGNLIELILELQEQRKKENIEENISKIDEQIGLVSVILDTLTED